MGLFIMPVRNRVDDPLADDFVIWDTTVDFPIARGTGSEVAEYYRDRFGWQVGGAALLLAFDAANRYGSSQPRWSGAWDSQLTLAADRYGLGTVPRAKLRELCDIVFASPIDEGKLTALFVPLPRD